MSSIDPPRDALARLPRSIDPGRDLWPGIEARLAEPPRRRRWDLALAAGLAAAFVLALSLNVRERGGADAVADRAAYRQPLDAAYAPLRAASLERYRAHAERLDPKLSRTVEANLAIIDRALGEIRAELARDPDNAALGQLLRRTYEQELAFIDSVAPPPAPVSTDYRGAL